MWREYERASTTIADAFVKPIVGDYVDQVGAELERALSAEAVEPAGLERRLRELRRRAAAGRLSCCSRASPAASRARGISRHGRGGRARRSPSTWAAPAATSALIADGVEQLRAGVRRRLGDPGDHPVRLGGDDRRGGGSIAWIDKGGLLRVGPQSAGAEPGPVAYGRGGELPTLTDANLVLGRLSPDYFLGGRMDAGSARRRSAPTRRSATAARARRGGDGAGGAEDRRRGDGERDPAGRGRGRARPARVRADRVRRRRAAARALGRLAARDLDASWSRRRPASARRSAP